MNPSLVLTVSFGIFICIAETFAHTMMWPPRPGDEGCKRRVCKDKDAFDLQTQSIANHWPPGSGPVPGKRSLTRRMLTEESKAEESNNQEFSSTPLNPLDLQTQSIANHWPPGSGPVPGKRSLTRRMLTEESKAVESNNQEFGSTPPNPLDEDLQTQSIANHWPKFNSGPPPGRRSLARRMLRAINTNRGIMWPPRPGDESGKRQESEDNEIGSTSPNPLDEELQTQSIANHWPPGGGPYPGRRSLTRRMLREEIKAEEPKNQGIGLPSPNSFDHNLQTQSIANHWPLGYGEPAPGKTSLDRLKPLKRSYGQKFDED